MAKKYDKIKDKKAVSEDSVWVNDSKESSLRNLDIVGVYDGWITDQEHYAEGYVPKNIGISRLGLCVRQTCLMMSGAKKRDISKEEMENLRRMFRQAKLLEEDYRLAYTEKRVLYSYQTHLTDWLPKGWGGFLDFLILKNKEIALIEMKATHPNNFRFASSLPKVHNVLQAKGYVYGCNEASIPVSHYKVLYVDRGGQNRPLAFSFEYGKEDEIEVLSEMNRQMSAWQTYKKDKIYPDPMGRVLQVKQDKKKNIYEIFLGQSWQCSYCDFCGTSCVPDKSRNKVGEFLPENNQVKMRKDYEKYEGDVHSLLREEDIIE